MLEGIAYIRRRQGRFDEALRYYRRAVDRRSWLPNSRSGLSQTYRELGRFDEARQAAEGIGDEGWREYELATVEVHRALACQREHDREGQRDAALAAMQHFRNAAAVEHTDNPKQGRERIGLLLAAHLAENELQLALIPQLAAMRSDPRNARQIANLSSLLVAPLDDDARGRLRLWLLDLAIVLSPDNPEYREQRAALLRDLRSR